MKALWGKMGRRARIWLGIALAVLVIVALILLGRGRRTPTSEFQTSPLARGELTASVGATGTVRAAQSAVLNWQTTGTVERVGARIGDAVKRDDVLATLAMDSVPQTVIQAQASLVAAQRALQDARSSTASAQAAIALNKAEEAYKKAYEYRLSLNGKQWIQEARIKYLGGQQIPEIIWRRGYVDEGTIRDADESLALRKGELDDARRNYERLKNGPNPDDIAAAQANVDAAQATLNTASIISPIDGVITQSLPLVGDHVTAGAQAFRVDDLSRLLVDVEVSEIDINNVEVGQPVQLTLDAVSNTTYRGEVEQVAQAGDTASGAVLFTVTVRMSDPDSAVKPGMTAAVNIVVKQVANQLLVPNRAVRLVDGERVVYVLKDGRPLPIRVSLGASSDTMSVLVSGDLAEGDLIILNPPSVGRGPFGGGPG
ncbi:MAG TPA: efflux RND transporter periplasmic adaptor subunit [Anaerolineales bacterium]|nr:efflux RND transporter periplasmic adaptor subunit [Anaerolineales bacterium]